MTKTISQATGRRKKAIARVRLVHGEGQILVNGRTLEDYFPVQYLQSGVLGPLALTHCQGRYDVVVTVRGGGIAGQAGAVRHGVSRALVRLDLKHRPVLKKAGFLTRDPRVKERKKYGLKKARKAPQFSKR